MKTFNTSMVIVFMTITMSFSQSAKTNYTVLFKSGAFVPEENISVFIQESQLKSLPFFDRKYYALIQFNEMPGNVQQKQLNKTGIRLLSYIPHLAWIASIDEQINISELTTLNFRSITPLQATQKLSEELKGSELPSHALKVNGKADLILRYYKNADDLMVATELRKSGCEILKKGINLSTYTVRVNVNDINRLVLLPFVQYIQVIDQEPNPYDTKGRSLDRNNVINSDYINGLHYDGNGVTVSTADDGSLNHIDFKGRLTDLTEFGQGGSHGDMTSGIFTGTGNLNPVNRGTATGAHLVLFDIFGSSHGDYPQIVNAVANYNNYDAVIASTSYGQGCNTYDNFSQEIDMLLYNNTQLTSCFAAGNSNGTNCGYGAGNQWGNVVAGYQQGKNVTTCANLNPNGVIDNLSSRGPAADGRIKPDIAACGKGQMTTDQNNSYQVSIGTSSASPAVAGCFAQLYQAYKSFNGGVNPEGALIKACILNSATDIGNPGPDYIFGWGSINARQAYKTIAGSAFLKDSVTHTSVNIHPITVPNGVAQLKVMVYWNDVEGDPAAYKALVNDIDITIIDPSSSILYPLVLDPTPNATTLNAPAVPGTDTLNNMEQVSINAPAAGNYIVNASGTEIPSVSQSYYLVWDFIMDEIIVTYPNGGEGFVPGESELLRWDAVGDTGNFMVEYSTDNGISYTTASSTIAGNLRQYNWIVPSTISGDAIIRVSRNGVSDINDTTFTIIGVPQNLTVLYCCPDSIGLEWTAVPGATGYEISYLGAMYMEPIVTTAGNTFTVLGMNPNDDLWFSVKAIGPNGAKGRRAIAVQKAPGTYNCILASDIALISVANPVINTYRDCASNSTVPVTILLKNYSQTPVTTCPVSYTFNGTTFNETFNGNLNTNDSAVFSFSTTLDLSVAGNYDFKTWVGLATDLNGYNDTVSFNINVLTGNIAQPPVVEDFELAFPPAGYNLVSSGNVFTWEQITGIPGSSGGVTTAAFFDNFNFNYVGAEDNLETRIFDLTGATVNAIITFDVAYAAYSAAYEDGLRIDLSTDCGNTYFPSGYLKTGLSLSSIPTYYSAGLWTPGNANQWRNDTLMLTPYIGNTLMARFVNINGYGNSLYIDNINVQQDVPLKVDELSNWQKDIRVFPNPSSGVFYLIYENNSQKSITAKVLDIHGRELINLDFDFTQNMPFVLDLSGYSKGIYLLEMRNNESVIKCRLIVL